MADHSFDRNQEATCYIGDLDTQVTEALLSMASILQQAATSGAAKRARR